jgi:hypothetical protein
MRASTAIDFNGLVNASRSTSVTAVTAVFAVLSQIDCEVAFQTLMAFVCVKVHQYGVDRVDLQKGAFSAV